MLRHFSPCCVYRAVDDRVTMSLLHCESGCGPSQSESDCCAAMAASSCGTAAKDDSVSGAASAVTLSSSFMEEIQGYDVEFDPPLESKYECPICLMALREAVQTPCGHRFCKACIIKSIRYVSIKNEPNAVTTKWNIITQNNLIQKKLPQGKEQWTENGEIYILIPILTVA